MLLVLFYGIIKGLREIFKKKALQKNSVTEVLFVYTFLSLVIAVPQLPHAMGLAPYHYGWAAVKAFIIFVAWMLGFKAVKKLPISLIGVLDLSRVLFATALGVVVLGEKMTLFKIIGLCLVAFGLLFLKFNPLKFKKKEKIEDMAAAEVPVENDVKNSEKNAVVLSAAGVPKKERKEGWYVFFAVFGCVLNAISGTLDKIFMREMNNSQLFFWYVFFLTVYYGLYALIRRKKIDKSVWKNVWIWLLAVGLVVMDNALFIANGMPESQVTVMTLIKQVSVIVAIVAGKFVFHERNILHKCICALIIIAGIVIGVAGV